MGIKYGSNQYDKQMITKLKYLYEGRISSPVYHESPIILHLLLLLEHCEAQVSYLEGLGTMKACLSRVFLLASQYLGW